MIFEDRKDAGKKLALLLQEYEGSSAVVVGLPRGGVVTAKEVARSLNLPLEIVVVKKIGHPFQSEYAVGAVSEKGFVALNEAETQLLQRDWLVAEKEKKLQEAQHKRSLLWGDRPVLSLEGKIVIVVDDGIATGYTMAAAIKHIQSQKPQKIVVAVPVAPRDTLDRVKDLAEEVKVLYLPEMFAGAVGSYYHHFSEVTDDQAKLLLDSRKDPILFGMSGMESFVQGLESQHPELDRGIYRCVSYANHELRIELETDVKNKDIIFVGSISPPHERIMETFLFCHTCRKDGALSITAVLPYMAYTRHDHDKPKEDQALALLADLARSSGISQIITVDIHGIQSPQLFPMPVISCDPWLFFAKRLQEMNIVPDVFIAPDEGAEQRVLSLKKALNSSAGVVVFHKERSLNTVTSAVQSGEVKGEVAVIVDDIIDTGKTVLLALSELKARGVKKIFLVATHAVCSDRQWLQLFNQGVERIFTTNSIISSPAANHSRCETISIAQLLAENINKNA